MEEIIFKTTVETGTTVNDINAINKALNNTDDAVQEVTKDTVKLGAKFEDVYGDLQPLSSRLGEIEDRMYELALAGKQNTKEFQILQEEVVRYRQTIIEVDRAVDTLAEQGRGLGTALQLGNAVVSGYGAVQGAMALVGNESEDLQKVMVKLQAVQAVLNSLEQIKITLDQKSIILANVKAGLTKGQIVLEKAYAIAVGTTTGAMKALRLAMLAIPIVAIIAGIVALISVIADLVSEEEKAEEANEALTASYERQQAVIDRIFEKRSRDIENQIKLRKSEGATAEELHQLEIQRIKEQEAQRRKTVEVEMGMAKSRKEQYHQALKEGNMDLAKEIKAEINQHRAKYKDLQNMEGQYKVDLQVMENEFQKQQANEANERQKTANDNYKKRKEEEKKRKEDALKLEQEFEKTLEDLRLATLEESGYKQLEILRVQQEREKAELVKKYGERSTLVTALQAKQNAEMLALTEQLNKDNQTKLDELNAEEAQKLATSRKAKLEGELIAMTEDFYARQELEKELARIEMEEALLREGITEGEKVKIKAEYTAKIDQINKESAEYEIEQAKKVAEEKELIEQQIRASAQNLADAYFSTRLALAKKGSKEELKLAKQQFQVNKSMQLAMATIDGFKAITSSLAQSPIAIGPLPNPAGIASLAFATTTSIANIAKILATKFEGGGQSVSAPTPPSISPSSATQTPISQFNGSSSTLTGNLPNNQTQVVVVDSDITAQQNNTQRVKTLSSIM
jgi:hypothetical protein